MFSTKIKSTNFQWYDLTLYISNFDRQKRLLNKQKRLWNQNVGEKKSVFFIVPLLSIRGRAKLVFFLVYIPSIIYALQCVQNTTLNLWRLVSYLCYLMNCWLYVDYVKVNFTKIVLELTGDFEHLGNWR